MFFILLLFQIVKNNELRIKAKTIKLEVRNMMKESMLFKFLNSIFLSKGLYTAMESGKVFHITKKAPKLDVMEDINILFIPFIFILFIFIEYSLESESLSLLDFLK